MTSASAAWKLSRRRVARLAAPLTRQGGWWRRYTSRAGLGEDVPPRFADVIARVVAFADPVLDGRLSGASWDSGARR